MKVQILSNLFPLPWEPNRAAFNRQQFEALAETCDVRILVIVAFLDRLKKLGKAVAHSKNNIHVDYLWYFYIPKFARFTYSASLLITLIFKIPQIKRYKPDCLLLSWAFPDAVAGIVLSRILKIPAVIKVHGSDINMHAEYSLRARQITWAMKYANGVISVSKALAARMVELGVPEEKIKVIYNGVNDDIFHPMAMGRTRETLKIDGQRTIILYIGNLKAEKGCNDLLTAFETIAFDRESVDLYYIGTGAEAETIRARVEEKGLNSRVKLLGSLDHGQLAQWINSSNLVALPSYNEGVPNVLLEAMACGKPVVATAVGGIPEIVPEHGGILCVAGDTQSLEKALVEALDRDWNAEQICNSMREYTWEKNSSQLSNLLESVINN